MMQFITSTACAGNGCVGVQMTGDHVLIMNTERPMSPVLAFTREEWADFIQGVKNGEFDVVA